MRPSYVKVYVGMDDNGSKVYSELIVPGRTLIIYESPIIEDSSGDDFVNFVERAMNESIIFSTALSLAMKIDKTSLRIESEELGDTVSRKICKLVSKN